MTTPETCGCCPIDLTRCWQAPLGNVIPVAAMLCDGVVRWFDSNGNEVDTAGLVDCNASPPPSNLVPVNVTYLAHPDDWPVALTGARRNKFTGTDPQPTGGSVTAAGTCRDGSLRIVRGPCAGNPGTGGSWNQQMNNVGVPNFSWADGSLDVWSSIDAWLIVPLAVNPVNIVASATAGNAVRRLETGTEPANRVLRGPNTFAQALDTSCGCLGALGFGFAYGRAMAADGYFQGSNALSYDIGSGVVLVPRNRSVPSDANSQVPTDPRTFCADILPQFYVTVSAWQNPITFALFEDDKVTPLVINGSCITVT